MNPDTTNQPSQPAGIPPVQGTPAPMASAPEKGGMGGVIALVIIVLALLAGGYFLMQKMGGDSMMAPEVVSPVVENTEAPSAPGAESQAAVDSNTIQGTSIELSDIEKDINTTDLDALTADLNAI